MIIEKIEMVDFLCYYGDNTIEFKEGLNIIMGNNGYGKSKIYDAFYWVMYDQIYVTEKKQFLHTKHVKSNLICDRTKYESNGDNLTAKVKITFRDKISRNIYIIERKYVSAYRNGAYSDSYESELTVFKRDLDLLHSRPMLDQQEISRLIESILPNHIKEYLWFQGEQVDSIIDFNNQYSLTKAINVLSSIKSYDELIDITTTMSNNSNKEYNRETRAYSQDAAKSEELLSKIEQHKAKLLKYENDSSDLDDDIQIAESKCEHLISKLDQAQEFKSKKNEELLLIKQLEDLSIQLSDDNRKLYKRMFTNYWVLKPLSKYFDMYQSKYGNYEKKLIEDKAQEKAISIADEKVNNLIQNRLPLNVPEPHYVKWMLESQRCLVCDREAPKDSDPWKKIEELLNVPQIANKVTKNTYYEEYKRLYQNGIFAHDRIKNIDTDIEEVFKSRQRINNGIEELRASLAKKKNELDRLLDVNSITEVEAKDIIADYTRSNQIAKDKREDRSTVIQKILQEKEHIKNLQDQYDKLIHDEIPANLKIKNEIFRDLETISRRVRDKIYSELINQLELEANIHYINMTSGNTSSRGRIRLKKLPNHNYMPEIVDNNGVALPGYNVGNLTLVKFAVVMAIISARNQSRMMSMFTLITDAPTSVLDEDYTIGFCRAISNVYDQSIVMSKEFYKNKALREQLLTSKDIRLGNVYTLSPSIKESERENRTTLKTEIKLIN